MPLNIIGNNRTAFLDDCNKPEPAHMVGNFNQWIGHQPGQLGTRPDAIAGRCGNSNHSGGSGAGGAMFTEKIYEANQRLSARIVQAGTSHEELSFLIKYNPLTDSYYYMIWYTGLGTYYVSKSVNGVGTQLAAYPSFSYSIGDKLSFQWKNGVLALCVNESVVNSFADSSIPGPGKCYFAFYSEDSGSSCKIDDITVEAPFGPNGAWAGVGRPLPQLGWDL